MAVTSAGHHTDELHVRASDGATIIDVERVILATIQQGHAVELSIGRPLGQDTHHGLLKAGVRVRVESSERWACRMSKSSAHVHIIGPANSRAAASRRLSLARGESRRIDTTEQNPNAVRDSGAHRHGTLNNTAA